MLCFSFSSFSTATGRQRIDYTETDAVRRAAGLGTQTHTRQRNASSMATPFSLQKTHRFGGISPRVSHLLSNPASLFLTSFPSKALYTVTLT